MEVICSIRFGGWRKMLLWRSEGYLLHQIWKMEENVALTIWRMSNSISLTKWLYWRRNSKLVLVIEDGLLHQIWKMEVNVVLTILRMSCSISNGGQFIPSDLKNGEKNFSLLNGKMRSSISLEEELSWMEKNRESCPNVVEDELLRYIWRIKENVAPTARRMNNSEDGGKCSCSIWEEDGQFGTPGINNSEDLIGGWTIRRMEFNVAPMAWRNGLADHV